MNPSPMNRNGKTSEEIRKSYPLRPRTVGIFNWMPIGVKSNYDRMEVVDINGRILFSFEPNDFILMEMRFVKPCYILLTIKGSDLQLTLVYLQCCFIVLYFS